MCTATTEYATHHNEDAMDAICLFDHYAILKKVQKTFLLGQIARMVHKGKDYRRPVSYEDSRTSNIYDHNHCTIQASQ